MAWNQIVKYQIFKLSTVTQWQRKNQTFAFPLGRRHMATPRLWRSQNWHKTWRIHPKVLSNEGMKGVTDYFNPWFHFTQTYSCMSGLINDNFSIPELQWMLVSILFRIAGYASNIVTQQSQMFLKVQILHRRIVMRLQ